MDVLSTKEAVGHVRKYGKSFRMLNSRNFEMKQRYSSKWSKQWSTRSSLKEIVNFVFNESTQETRRTLLSRLILHKEMPRKRINPENWLQNEF